MLYVVVCTIDDGMHVFDVAIVIGVADTVFDELHPISGRDARTLLLGCLSPCGTLPVSLDR